MIDFKSMNEQIHKFGNLFNNKNQWVHSGWNISDYLPCRQTTRYLLDVAKILSHTQGDLILIQVLNSVRNEEQHWLREKAKSESKAKVKTM